MLPKRSRREPITLDTMRISEEILSAQEFLALTRDNPAVIKSSQVVAPKPGETGFGAFRVQYISPRYKAT